MTTFVRTAIVSTIIALAGCAGDAGTDPTRDVSDLQGAVKIDGSSTVYPITEAVAEEFRKYAPGVRVTVGISGTGGGFKRFSVGETDISDASRPIKAKELRQARENGVEFIEVPVAYDGLSIVVHPRNDWVDQLTVDQLRQIFLDGTTVDSWDDLNRDWPQQRIKIYSPGTDSGTFDYFKEVIAGNNNAIRSDMSVSEDDNVLIRGIVGDEYSIGFFGCAYYFENTNLLRVIPIVSPETGEAIEPTPRTIESGEYAPFSRPLFIYVNAKSAKRPEVRRFIEFYLDECADLAQEVGYVRLPRRMYQLAGRKFSRGITGTHFLNEKLEPIHGPLPRLYE